MLAVLPKPPKQCAEVRTTCGDMRVPVQLLEGLACTRATWLKEPFCIPNGALEQHLQKHLPHIFLLPLL